LIGGMDEAVGLARLALAAGVDVVVTGSRPDVWETLATGAAAGGGAPDGAVDGGRLRLRRAPAAAAAGGTPYRPVRSVVDTDRGFSPAPGRWTAEVLVRQRIDGDAVGLLARAGTVLSRPLTDAEATVASAALGSGAAAGATLRGGTGWLAVIGRRAVRWVTAGPRPGAGPGTVSAAARGSAPPADMG